MWKSADKGNNPYQKHVDRDIEFALDILVLLDLHNILALEYSILLIFSIDPNAKFH